MAPKTKKQTDPELNDKKLSENPEPTPPASAAGDGSAAPSDVPTGDAGSGQDSGGDSADPEPEDKKTQETQVPTLPADSTDNAGEAFIGDALITDATITNAAIGTTVPAGDEMAQQGKREAVVFLGPYHRYSRGDMAVFDAQYAQELVDRRIAVWPRDAKRAMSPRPGDDDYATDIG